MDSKLAVTIGYGGQQTGRVSGLQLKWVAALMGGTGGPQAAGDRGSWRAAD